MQSEIFEHPSQPVAAEVPTAQIEKPVASLKLESIVDETIKAEQQRIVSEDDRFRMQQRQAAMYFESGFFADLKSASTARQGVAQAMVKIQLGEAMGLTAIESMTSIYFVYGRPALDAQIRAARMKRAGYSWIIAEHTPKVCRLIPRYQGEIITDGNGKPLEISFSLDEAAKAGLVKKDGNWEKYAMDMLFARAITRVQRRIAPEVLMGAGLLDRSEAEELPETLPGNAARPLFAGTEESAK